MIFSQKICLCRAQTLLRNYTGKLLVFRILELEDVLIEINKEMQNCRIVELSNLSNEICPSSEICISVTVPFSWKWNYMHSLNFTDGTKYNKYPSLQNCIIIWPTYLLSMYLLSMCTRKKYDDINQNRFMSTQQIGVQSQPTCYVNVNIIIR